MPRHPWAGCFARCIEPSIARGCDSSTDVEVSPIARDTFRSEARGIHAKRPGPALEHRPGSIGAQALGQALVGGAAKVQCRLFPVAAGSWRHGELFSALSTPGSAFQPTTGRGMAKGNLLGRDDVGWEGGWKRKRPPLPAQTPPPLQPATPYPSPRT